MLITCIIICIPLWARSSKPGCWIFFFSYSFRNVETSTWAEHFANRQAGWAGICPLHVLWGLLVIGSQHKYNLICIYAYTCTIYTPVPIPVLTFVPLPLPVPSPVSTSVSIPVSTAISKPVPRLKPIHVPVPIPIPSSYICVCLSVCLSTYL